MCRTIRKARYSNEAVAAGVLYVVELSHQVAEERPGLAVLAG
jgi:hypothetical protein